MSRQRKELRMYEKEEFTYLSRDGRTKIRAIAWKPADQSVRAVLQIAHGMVEHIERYEEFAGYLAKYGIVTVGNDHLGHGKSVASTEDWGFFAEEEGNRAVIQDMHTLQKKMMLEYPQVPYFLLGHSMGSFLARSYLIRYPGTLRAAIIMGTGWQPQAKLTGGRAVAEVVCAAQGPSAASKLVNDLAFGGYNKAFAPNRTGYDWLSADSENVDRYIADPLCGADATVGLFRQMLHGIAFNQNPKNLARMDSSLPVLLISGDRDPVGDMGKGVRRTADAFRKAGLSDVTLKLYPGLRHEILNEGPMRQTVYEDIWHWLEPHLPAR